MSITTRIQQFEVYNQPLNEDPNTADLIGPAMVSIKQEEDFMEHAKLTIMAILGRKDIHKFQNTIESDVVDIDFPKSKLNLLAAPNATQEASIPPGATCTGVRVGHMRVIDWVNIYLMQNAVYGYQPCIQQPSIEIDDGNDGIRDAAILGAELNAAGTGYDVWALDHYYTDGVGESFDPVLLDITVPLEPEGIFQVVYYSEGFSEIEQEEPEVPSEPTEPMSCVGISNPAVRVALADGFVWKPISEGDGKLVVLFPYGSSGSSASIYADNVSIESGNYVGLTNGGRPTFRFSQVGASYPPNVTVCMNGTGGSGGGGTGEIELCGIAYGEISSPDFSFGEENGNLRSFPPLPLRVNNENYYASDDEKKISDIEKLSKIVEVDATKLIDEIMESEDVVGNEDKVDHVYLNFGTRIYDNTSASCKYMYTLFRQIRDYYLEAANGSFGTYPCFYHIADQIEEVNNPTVFAPDMCSSFTVETDGYYYEFTFSGVHEEVKSVAEVLADENLREQYEDRQRTSGKMWYISTSDGDNSKDEDYEQPEEFAGAWPSQEDEMLEISFGECDGNVVRFITVIGFGGKVRVIDAETEVVKMRRLNPDDPNSVLVPYIPAIGELMTNHELADNFLSGLHVSLYVADITVKAIPWWVVALVVIIVVLVAWTGYGGQLAAVTTETVMNMIMVTMVGYMVASIAVEIGGKTAGIIAAIVNIVIMVWSAGAGSGSFIGNLSTTFSTMALPQILGKILNIIASVMSTIVNSEMAGIGYDSSDLDDKHNHLMSELRKDQRELLDERGGFVGIEPLLDDLLATSIRTEVNPMAPSDYYDMYDKFHDIGTSLLNTGNVLEDPFNMNIMLQPV